MTIKLKNPNPQRLVDRPLQIDGKSEVNPTAIIEIETDDVGGLPVTDSAHNSQEDQGPFVLDRAYSKGDKKGVVEVYVRASGARLNPDVWRQLTSITVPVDSRNTKGHFTTLAVSVDVAKLAKAGDAPRPASPFDPVDQAEEPAVPLTPAEQFRAAETPGGGVAIPGVGAFLGDTVWIPDTIPSHDQADQHSINQGFAKALTVLANAVAELAKQ